MRCLTEEEGQTHRQGCPKRGLLHNHLVAEEPAVVAFGEVPLRQRAGVLGYDTQITGVELEVADGIGMDYIATLAEIGVELLGVCQFPGIAVGRGIDLDVLWSEDPVVGIVEEAHGDAFYGSDTAEVETDVYILAPITLPVAVGIGFVACQHPVGKGVVAAAAILGLVVAVAAVELAHFANGLVEEEVLFAVDGFAPFAVGDGFHQTAASDGEGAFVEIGAL